MTFSLATNSPLAVQKTRTYNRFSNAAKNVVDVRIYHGIHFRFADTAARGQGRQVAKWTFTQFLRLVDNVADDDEEDHDEED